MSGWEGAADRGEVPGLDEGVCMGSLHVSECMHVCVSYLFRAPGGQYLSEETSVVAESQANTLMRVQLENRDLRQQLAEKHAALEAALVKAQTQTPDTEARVPTKARPQAYAADCEFIHVRMPGELDVKKRVVVSIGVVDNKMEQARVHALLARML